MNPSTELSFGPNTKRLTTASKGSNWAPLLPKSVASVAGGPANNPNVGLKIFNLQQLFKSSFITGLPTSNPFHSISLSLNLGIIFGILITCGSILIRYLFFYIKKKISEFISRKRTGDKIVYDDAANGSTEVEHTYEEIRFYTLLFALFPSKNGK